MHTETGVDISKAAALLKEGNVVAIPTETVYGLAANALNADAVLKIYEAKQRPQFNPLIVHVSSWDRALQFVDHVPEEAGRLAHHFWPGPLTLLLEKKKNVPDIVTAGSNRVAIRIPNHILTLQLLQELDFPVAAPSANPSGYVSPTTAGHVYQNLAGKIPYILDGGACTVGVESTIVGWNEKGETEIYRLGGVGVEAIEQVLGKNVHIRQSITENPDAPGQLKSHYATHTPLYLGQIPDLIKQFEGKRMLLINFSKTVEPVQVDQQLILSPSGTFEEAAKNLFGVLREADLLQADVILAEKMPDEGLGRAINDRLSRAQFVMK